MNNSNNYRTGDSDGVIIAAVLIILTLVAGFIGLFIYMNYFGKRKPNFFTKWKANFFAKRKPSLFARRRSNKYVMSFRNKLANETEESFDDNVEMFEFELKNPKYKITQNRLSNGYF